MTAPANDMLTLLQAVNATSAFNRWAGVDVAAAHADAVELRLPWREEFENHAGLLHAGVSCALLEASCGFAAAAASRGNAAASHPAVNFLAPARGSTFVARARALKVGRRQVFVTAELTAEGSGDSVLVATGNSILVPLAT